MSEPRLTGRLTAPPSEIMHEEVLAPQFAYEVRHLLPGYLRAERSLLAQYHRMDLLDAARVTDLDRALTAIDEASLVADPLANLSDLAFAVERRVESTMDGTPGVWHVDRSRNDLQATAQRVYGLRRLLDTVRVCAGLAGTVARAAEPLCETVLPGYTHLQAAQVISPGFYLAALGEELLRGADRLLDTHRRADLCPLGAGAMSGQELPWDRALLARHNGFRAAERHALVAVAGRGWHLELAGDLAALAVTLGRFVTDMMSWAGEAYGLVELPDELAGISSAMPQKKNYPVFERVRGRLGHVVSLAADLTQAQRNTPYANSVEVGKEGGRYLRELFDATGSALRLLDLSVAGLRFRESAARAAVSGVYLGGFSLANALSLAAGVPWRAAQVLAGEYIRVALAAGLPPTAPDPELLLRLAVRAGVTLADPAGLLVEAFDPDAGLRRHRSVGSTHPDEVRAGLRDQRAEAARVAAEVDAREAYVRDTGAELDRELASLRDRVPA